MIYLIVFIAFAYAFINGFHDGGNVIATIIASRSLSPKKALVYACISELTGPVIFGTGVAATIGTGIIRQNAVTSGSQKTALFFYMAALLGAIIWNLITWYFRMPSSSSHALVGGMLGAGIMMYGFSSLNMVILFSKVLLVLFLSPLIGSVLGFLFFRMLSLLFKYYNTKLNKYIKKIQVISMIMLGLSHSSNDAQKSMGLIVMALLVSGKLNGFSVPLWVQLGCAAAITSGLYISGWRIVGTVGKGIFRVKPIHSFSAQLTAAFTIITASLVGSPVSSTQIINSTILGTGIAERKSAVKWKTVENIFLSWFTTIPASALIASALCLIFKKQV